MRIAATEDVIDAVFEVSDETLQVRSDDEVLGTWALPDISVENRSDGIHVSLDGERIVVSVPNPEAFTDALAPARRRPRGRRNRKQARAKREQGPVQSARPPRKRKAEEEPMAEAEEPPAPAASVAEPFPDDFDKPRSHAKSKKPGLLAGVVALLRETPALFNTDNWQGWLQDRLVRWTIASVGVIVLALVVLFAANTLGMILVLLGMVALIIAALAVSDDLSAYRMIPSALSETTMVIAGAISMVVGALLILIS